MRSHPSKGETRYCVYDKLCVCVCVRACVSIRCLWLSSNLIDYLPEDTTVQLLDYDPLTGDRKSLQSPGFGGLTSLEELWMESNRLEEIPPQFGRCISLRYINFRRNLIEDIPREICGLTKLENFVLTHNRFKEFPPPLFNLPSMHTLTFDHNEIRDMPKGLLAATNLTCLNLSHNPIEAIPSEIGLMTNLVQLYTSNGGKTPSTGQHLPGGWMRLHTMSSCFPVLDDDCVTIHPPTSRPGA
jgi:Leucine-rich repeat (LRR) protein